MGHVLTKLPMMIGTSRDSKSGICKSTTCMIDREQKTPMNAQKTGARVPMFCVGSALCPRNQATGSGICDHGGGGTSLFRYRSISKCHGGCSRRWRILSVVCLSCASSQYCCDRLSLDQGVAVLAGVSPRNGPYRCG